VLIGAWVLQPRRDDPVPVEGTLVLRLAAGRPPDADIEAVLKKHLAAHRLVGLGTARGGSALDVTYAVRQPGPEQVFALVNELSRREPRKYVKATLKEGDKVVYKDVGVHLKGAAGSFRYIDDKPNVTVNMNKFGGTQLFHGMDKFHLTNSLQDPSYIEELICG